MSKEIPWKNVEFKIFPINFNFFPGLGTPWTFSTKP